MKVSVWMPLKVRAPPRSPNAQTSRPDVGGAATGADGHQPSARTPTDAATSSNGATVGYWTGVPVSGIEPDESAHGVRWMGLGRCWRPDARSAVKH
jgi:hypothetical protein